MTDDEKLKRDRREEALIAAGKPLGYNRTEKQAAAAKANVKKNSSRPASPAPGGGGSGGGGKSGGKGKDPNAPCWNFTNDGKCSWGKNCKFRKNTPGHP